MHFDCFAISFCYFFLIMRRSSLFLRLLLRLSPWRLFGDDDVSILILFVSLPNPYVSIALIAILRKRKRERENILFFLSLSPLTYAAPVLSFSPSLSRFRSPPLSFFLFLAGLRRSHSIRYTSHLLATALPRSGLAARRARTSLSLSRKAVPRRCDVTLDRLWLVQVLRFSRVSSEHRTARPHTSRSCDLFSLHVVCPFFLLKTHFPRLPSVREAHSRRQTRWYQTSRTQTNVFRRKEKDREQREGEGLGGRRRTERRKRSVLLFSRDRGALPKRATSASEKRELADYSGRKVVRRSAFPLDRPPRSIDG